MTGQKDYYVQPFNEVNIEDTFIKPDEHMNDFLKAAEQIEKAGGKTILTPLSQNGDGDAEPQAPVAHQLDSSSGAVIVQLPRPEAAHPESWAARCPNIDSRTGALAREAIIRPG